MIKVNRIVIGSYNQKKKKEIRSILSGEPFTLLDLEDFEDPPDIVEDGVTFEENAIKKAIELAVFCEMCVVADDSGLEVDALDKRPGIFSSRYCGVDTSDSEKCLNILKELEGVPSEKRTARFRCAIALAGP
ncbi:MAG: non-canonical purine NTP pyrophosphatase, partial [Candidatus Brocadiaceae bacterium]|nr:non-canonical purine NTP pyrophosphatase [Candidatus Brocadiaceae bacterium]